MGSSHSVGPWSVMQAALQVGAATSRPSYACGSATCSVVRAWTVADIASASSDVASRYVIFIVRLLDCGREATARIEVARIGDALPTDQSALTSADCLAEIAVHRLFFAPI